MTTTPKKLNLFNKYIMDEFAKVKHNHETDKIYLQLKELYETGHVKGVLKKDATIDEKSEWLTTIATKLDDHYNQIILRSKLTKIKEKL